jgi:hypothetical protein
MAQAIISRRGGESGSGYATITFNGVSDLKKTDVAGLIALRSYLAATTVGNYALFGGGTKSHGSTASADFFATVDAYNTSLTRTTPTALGTARSDLAATTVGDYALFGGGAPGYLTAVDSYDSTLYRRTPLSLSAGRYALAATTIGSYALFVGGRNGSDIGFSSTVDAYNTSLTRSTPTALSQAKECLAATTVGNYALFGGGYLGSGNYSSIVNAYNTSLTRSTPTALSQARYYLAATTVGDYALFGGWNTVNAYYVNNKVQVYPGTKYKLGSMSSESTSSTMQEIETTAPITGYIKIKDATIN